MILEAFSVKGSWPNLKPMLADESKVEWKDVIRDDKRTKEIKIGFKSIYRHDTSFDREFEVWFILVWLFWDEIKYVITLNLLFHFTLIEILIGIKSLLWVIWQHYLLFLCSRVWSDSHVFLSAEHNYIQVLFLYLSLST